VNTTTDATPIHSHKHFPHVHVYTHSITHTLICVFTVHETEFHAHFSTRSGQKPRPQMRNVHRLVRT